MQGLVRRMNTMGFGLTLLRIGALFLFTFLVFILSLKQFNMQPINKQDVLIRLLKDGHISNEEFKALWDSMPKPIIREVVQGDVDNAYEQGIIRGNSIKDGIDSINNYKVRFDPSLSQFTQLEEGFEDKLQTVQSKKGGGFWVTVEGNGV